MNWIIQSIFLGISLAMDATTVAVSDGLAEGNMKKNKMFFISLLFGIFQGVMPLIGYLFASLFSKYIENITTYISFTLLVIIGIKMIVEGIKIHEEEKVTLNFQTIIIQAIATSIDALTVGIVFVSAYPYQAYISFAIIAVITFFLSFLGTILGKKFGNLFSKKAQICGGIILIIIGIKILVTSL